MDSVEIAKQKLQESDWSVLSDVDATLVNKNEFVKYREALRMIVVQELNCAVFPTEPVPVWSYPTAAA